MSNSFQDMLDEGVVIEGVEGITALIDGDILAHRAANATDGRFYTITGLPGESHKYKKDAVAAATKAGLTAKDVEIDFMPEPVSHAVNIVKTLMRTIQQALEARHGKVSYEVYLSVPSAEGFRVEVNPAYKANRVGGRKPKHLDKCKDYLRRNWRAVSKRQMEADDLLAIRTGELNKDGQPWVIVSIDKDLKQIAGDHFDFVNDEYVVVDETEAKYRLWHQVLIGDSTDNIFTPRLLGDKKAKAYLDENFDSSLTKEELLNMCTEVYSEYMEKHMKVKDTSDARCWVEQTYEQVYLKRFEDGKGITEVDS